MILALIDLLKLKFVITSLEAAGALRVAAPSLGLIPPPTPTWSAGFSWGWCGCLRDPTVRPNSRSAEYHALMVLIHSCYVVLGFQLPLHRLEEKSLKNGIFHPWIS